MFAIGDRAVFHETAPTVNEKLFLPSPTSTQASIRILMSLVLPGSMQVGFRVKVRRCHLSRELRGSSLLTQSPDTDGFSSLRQRRKN